MITTIEKPTDYRHFLLGIVFFALFEIVWWSISPVFFALECVLPPVFVVIGEKLLKLAAFYYLFCKATVWDIQWKHLLAVLLLYAVIQLLAYLSLFSDSFDHLYGDSIYDISNLTMWKIRLWSWVITTLVIMSFLWWNVDASEPGTESGTMDTTNRYLCGGMLFFLTFRLVLFSVDYVANSYWPYTYHPVLLDCVFYPLLLAIAAAAIYLIICKKMVVPPLAVLLALLALFVFTKWFLPNIVFQHYFKLEPTDDFYFHFFTNVSGVCYCAVFLTAFYLYRKSELDAPTSPAPVASQISDCDGE